MKFYLKMKKKIYKFGLNYHRYMVQPIVLHILRCSFWKYQWFKISPPVEVTSPLPLGGEYCPHFAKIIYDLTIALINKSFEFQSDWLKIIRITYNCLQFCPTSLSWTSKWMYNNSAPLCSMRMNLLLCYTYILWEV